MRTHTHSSRANATVAAINAVAESLNSEQHKCESCMAILFFTAEGCTEFMSLSLPLSLCQVQNSWQKHAGTCFVPDPDLWPGLRTSGGISKVMLLIPHKHQHMDCMRSWLLEYIVQGISVWKVVRQSWLCPGLKVLMQVYSVRESFFLFLICSAFFYAPVDKTS